MQLLWKKIRHIESMCFKIICEYSNKVNLMNESNVILTPMKISVGNFQCVAFYYCGASRSLIRRSLSSSFPGKQEECLLMLKGIGSESVPILSCQQIKTMCNINNVFVEIIFHIIEDHETPCDVLIGADIEKQD